MNRTSISAWLLILGILCNLGVAQDEPRKEILRTVDVPIHITYYPAWPEANPSGVRNAPVVVFLHGENESRLLWDKNSGPRGQDPFPVLLQKRGYAAITVDFRKHGDSKVDGKDGDMVQPADYELMAMADMGAVKDFIRKEHQNQKLNMRKMAIVASGFAAPIAARFAQYDWTLPPFDDHALASMRTPRGQDVRALVLLSPQANAGRLQSGRWMNFLRNPDLGIALMVVVGNDDTTNKSAANTYYRSFSSNSKNAERVELATPPTKDKGIALMTTDPGFAYVPVLKFLDQHVKPLDEPWTDRRSRLER